MQICSPVEKMQVYSEKHNNQSTSSGFFLDPMSKPDELLFLSNIYHFIDQHFKQKKKHVLFRKINEITGRADWNTKSQMPHPISQINMISKTHHSVRTQNRQLILKNDFLSSSSSDEHDNIFSDQSSEGCSRGLLNVFVLKILNYFLSKAAALRTRSRFKYLRQKVTESSADTATKTEFICDLLVLFVEIYHRNLQVASSVWQIKQDKQIEKILEMTKKPEINESLVRSLRTSESFLKIGVFYYFKKQSYERCFAFINTGFQIINEPMQSGGQSFSSVLEQKNRMKEFFQKVIQKIKDLRVYQMEQQKRNLQIMEARERINLSKFHETNKHSIFCSSLLGEREFDLNSRSGGTEDFGAKRIQKQITKEKKISVEVRKQKKSRNYFRFPNADFGDQIECKTLKKIEDEERIERNWEGKAKSGLSKLIIKKSSIEEQLQEKNAKKSDKIKESNKEANNKEKTVCHIYSNEWIHNLNSSRKEPKRITLAASKKASKSDESQVNFFYRRLSSDNARQDPSPLDTSCPKIIQQTSSKQLDREVMNRDKHRPEPKMVRSEQFELKSEDNEFGKISSKQRSIPETPQEQLEGCTVQNLQEMINNSLPFTNHNMARANQKMPLFNSKAKYTNEQLNSIMDTPYFDTNHPNMHFPMNAQQAWNPFEMHQMEQQALNVEVPFKTMDISPIDSFSNLDVPLGMSKKKRIRRNLQSRLTFKKKLPGFTETSVNSGILSKEEEGPDGLFRKEQEHTRNMINKFKNENEAVQEKTDEKQKLTSMEANLRRPSANEKNSLFQKKVNSKRFILKSEMSIDKSFLKSKEEKTRPKRDERQLSDFKSWDQILESRAHPMFSRSVFKNSVATSDVSDVQSYIYSNHSKQNQSIPKNSEQRETKSKMGRNSKFLKVPQAKNNYTQK